MMKEKQFRVLNYEFWDMNGETNCRACQRVDA